MLLRFDPAREADRFAQSLLRDTRANFAPIDSYRVGDNYVVELDLPGVDADSIDLTVENNVMTVAAHRTTARQNADGVLIAERFSGSYKRSVYLGSNLDASKVSATYEQGVLRVEIPVAESSKSHKVRVETVQPKAQVNSEN